ncbi:hypothetical protein BPUTSESOX_747 [uncultured Gammaproteobacteria bacterium]|jgi:hypothetical protein|nr:hypothetical protein [uncultured Gammaproteobacteria bacterium]VVH50953.1 hypothetical protein BPUTSESOX_747 [uncultured Gammaproteobacteria bacterium]
MIKHCCKEIGFFLEEDKVRISYNNIFREYSIELNSNATQLIYYCPWCGSKLPKSLDDEYLNKLEKLGYGDLGIFFELQELIDIEPNNEWLVERTINMDLEKSFSLASLPDELTPNILKKFKTDKWWKKE